MTERIDQQCGAHLLAQLTVLHVDVLKQVSQIEEVLLIGFNGVLREAPSKRFEHVLGDYICFVIRAL
ncbi:hypothetical protein HV85_15705 [Pseudomonas aeruginosa]|nr:hypothetical protein HV85_15705 [Pseudomonas aeruginosa]